jgi:hypothetical protein
MSVTTPQFEIPSEMRVVAQRSIEQANLAFENYMRMTWDASSRFEARVEESQADVQEVGNKTMNFVLHNITLTFEFCQRVVQVKEPAELLRLLNDFIQSQMQILSEQVKNLGLALSKVAMDGMKDLGETASKTAMSVKDLGETATKTAMKNVKDLSEAATKTAKEGMRDLGETAEAA